MLCSSPYGIIIISIKHYIVYSSPRQQEALEHRVAIGVLCFILGGGKWSDIGIVAGVGTIVTAFFMGPLINFFNIKVSGPFLG